MVVNSDPATLVQLRSSPRQRAKPCFQEERMRSELTKSGKISCALAIVAVGTLTMFSLDSNAAQQRDDEIGARPQQSDIEDFMARKLKAAQRTLEAVMTDQFEDIKNQSAELMDLSRHAAWKQLASSTYIQDTADFVATAEFLHRMAEAKDSTGVSLGYAKLVQSCAACHQHVRAPRIALNRHKTNRSSLQLATVQH